MHCLLKEIVIVYNTINYIKTSFSLPWDIPMVGSINVIILVILLMSLIGETSCLLEVLLPNNTLDILIIYYTTY